MIRRIAVLAATTIAVLGVAGCSGSSPQPQQPVVSSADATEPGTEAPEAQQRNIEFQAAVETFPYELPDGYSFPENAPDQDWPGTDSPSGDGGEVTANRVYGCAMLLSAWEAAHVGDYASASARHDELATHTDELAGLEGWEATVTWDSPAAFLNGLSGYCYAWQIES